MVQTMIVASADAVSSFINESVKNAIKLAIQDINLKVAQPNMRKVSRREAAKIEGISVSMLDKVRDNYVSELIGSKRVFLVKDGQLVKSSLSD